MKIKAEQIHNHTTPGQLLNGTGLADLLELSPQNFRQRRYFRADEVEKIVCELKSIVEELEADRIG